MMMNLEQLQQLVPRFRKGLRRSLQPPTMAEVNVASVEMSANLIDGHCLGVDITIHEQKINRALIDGGSRVNVITKETCE